MLDGGPWKQPRPDAWPTTGKRGETLAADARERPNVEAKPAEIEPACRRADRRQPEIHKLHRLAFGNVTEGLAVKPFEGVMQRCAIVRTARHWNGELRGLTEVTNVGRTAELHRGCAVS